MWLAFWQLACCMRLLTPVKHARPLGDAADTAAFRLRPDGVALFSAASTDGAGRPDPPFCLKRGCISGPAQRGRLAALRDALGWVALEPEGSEDAVWTQILLH